MPVEYLQANYGNKSDTDYTYDDNGKLVIDNNKQVQFIWNNEIDRITEIKSADGQRSIQFVYDAEGNRCQKKIIDGNITTVYSYIDGFVYRNDSLLYFNNAYGRVRRTMAGILVYDYFITDNLGNIRTVLTEDVWFDDLKVTHQAGPLLQESTLYPYGQEIVSQSSKRLKVTANPYLYQAKELDDEFDIGLYNFGARFYDPQTGRFISVDPVRMMISGYAAMGCNPVMYVDPDGRFIQFIPAIIGAVIGGATDLIGNWDAISHAPSLGSAIFGGVGYGLTGVVSGALTGMG